MRCKYCHNPDTWGINVQANKISVNEILKQYNSVKEFCKGGITVTGGEPLIQTEFVTELFKEAKSLKIHTALDTSGILFNPEKHENIDNLLKYTDLVLLDIKHIDDEEHKKLTSHSNKNILAFARYLSDKNIPVWIRHVVVPGINDDKNSLTRLGKFIATLKNINALDVLPYHDMAIGKYKELKLDYPLKGVPPLTKNQAIEARNYILEGMRNI